MWELLNNFKAQLESAKNKTDYYNAWNAIVESLEEAKSINIDGVNVSQYETAITDAYSNTPIPTIEDTKQNRDGSTITRATPLFKRPELSIPITSKLHKAISNIQKQQIAKQAEIDMRNRLSHQPKAIKSEVGKALKAVLFNSKAKNTITNVNYILDFINQVKRFDSSTDYSAYYYMSNTPEGGREGGNGKSTVINGLVAAVESLNLPYCNYDLPSKESTEIVPDFGNNVLSIVNDCKLSVDEHTTNKILDHDVYQVHKKYVSTFNIKSICTFFGSTNDSLADATQTFARRMKIITINEAMKIKALPAEEFQQIPTPAKIESAWKYLLTHDVSDCYPSTKETIANISSAERDILYILVDFKEEVKSLHNSEPVAGNILKNCIENHGKKIPLARAMRLAYKYGAKCSKAGNHGREDESSAFIDVSEMNIDNSMFAEGNPFQVPEVYELIDKEYGSNNPDGDGIDWSELDAELAKDEIYDDLAAIDKGFADWACGKNKPEEKAEEKPAMQLYDTIPESNSSYSQATIPVATNQPEDQFETINPQENNRFHADSNCASMRNFVFECDDASIDEQKGLAEQNKSIINRVVYSGGKSLHMRVTINFEPESKDEYAYIHNYINQHYFAGKADTACKNPSRLTRKPNSIRVDTHKRQVQMFTSKTVFNCEWLHEEYLNWKKQQEEAKALKDMIRGDTSFKGKRYDTIAETIDNMKNKDSEAWQATKAALEGEARYEEGQKAIRFCKWLGFSYEQFVSEIEQGNWNFKESYWDSLEV